MSGKAYDPSFIFAWPNAKIAVMGGDQAAKTLTSLKISKLGSISDEEKCRYSSCDDNIDSSIPCPEDKQCSLIPSETSIVWENKEDTSKDILELSKNDCIKDKKCNGINKEKDKIILEKVLLIKDKDSVSIGKPYIKE